MMSDTETRQVLDALRHTLAGYEAWGCGTKIITDAIAICEASLARVVEPAKSLREVISAALDSEISPCGYDCTRVWEAWHFGTMSQDDFVPMSDRLDEIVETIAVAVEATPQAAAQPSQAGEWLPIETAPKDMFARLYRVKGFCVQGFVDAAGVLCAQNDLKPWRKMHGKPTHWMLLPTPPKGTP